MTTDPAFTTSQMSRVFSPDVRVQCMLHFEAALARALASCNVIPAAAAEAIADACRVERFDVAAILRDGAVSGTPAVPLVAALREAVPDHARGFVHAGATSQDVIDSGLMLQMDYGFALLLDDLVGLGRACASLADAHRETIMVGRTLGQHALPLPFGLKAAQWLSAVTAAIQRLRSLRSELVVQLGGAVGTLATFGDSGADVAAAVADDLHLGIPALPWHSDRSRVAAIVAGVGLAARASGKIAADIVSLMSTEIAEVAERSVAGKGRSSTMPHKRNPVDAVAAQAATRLALGNVGIVLNAFDHEHERAAGAWQAEWAAVPDVFRYGAGAIRSTRLSVEGLQVDVARMRANLQHTSGLVMAEALAGVLAEHIGRDRANDAVARVCEAALDRGIDLASAAQDHDVITATLRDDEIRDAVDPQRYLGSSDALISRAVDGFSAIVGA